MKTMAVLPPGVSRVVCAQLSAVVIVTDERMCSTTVTECKSNGKVSGNTEIRLDKAGLNWVSIPRYADCSLKAVL